MHPSIARTISLLGHPLLVLTYMLLLMSAVDSFAFGAAHLTEKRSMLLLFYVFFTTFLIPALGIGLLRPLGLVKSLSLADKQERIGPYIITGVFYLWMFKNISAPGSVPPLYAAFVLGAAVGLFFAFFANIFFKISAHAAGMGALVGMSLLLAFEWAGKSLSLGGFTLSLNALLAFSIVFAGLVCTARMSLRQRNLAEIGLGFVLGFAAVNLAHLIL
jgi:hypothetical protein